MDGAGLLGHGGFHGFSHRGPDAARLELRAPFGDGGVKPPVVDVHLHRPALPETSDLGRDRQERDTIQEGVSDSGRHVVAPGPSVERQAPTLPVRRLHTSPMNLAEASWATATNSTGPPWRASISRAFGPAIYPKR